jgi:hypothetical protein
MRIPTPMVWYYLSMVITLMLVLILMFGRKKLGVRLPIFLVGLLAVSMSLCIQLAPEGHWRDKHITTVGIEAVLILVAQMIWFKRVRNKPWAEMTGQEQLDALPKGDYNH